MPSFRGAARATVIIVGLTIAVLIGTAALLAVTHSNSASRQQRLVVGSYETLSLMRQAVIACRTAIAQPTFRRDGDLRPLKPISRIKPARQLKPPLPASPTTRQVRNFVLRQQAGAHQQYDRRLPARSGRGAGAGSFGRRPCDQRSDPPDRRGLHQRQRLLMARRWYASGRQSISRCCSRRILCLMSACISSSAVPALETCSETRRPLTCCRRRWKPAGPIHDRRQVSWPGTTVRASRDGTPSNMPPHADQLLSDRCRPCAPLLSR
jgi:hypothetical protein